MQDSLSKTPQTRSLSLSFSLSLAFSLSRSLSLPLSLVLSPSLPPSLTHSLTPSLTPTHPDPLLQENLSKTLRERQKMVKESHDGNLEQVRV